MSEQANNFLQDIYKSNYILINIIYKYVSEIPSMIYKIDLKYTNKGCIKDFNDIYQYIEQHKE